VRFKYRNRNKIKVYINFGARGSVIG
jgi:hypothetical protein